MISPRHILLTLLLFLPAHASAQTWTLAWSDEFNGAANSPINSANWEFQVGINNVNDELEYYCAPTTNTNGCNPSTPNAYIDGNGHLVIQAIELNNNTAPYTGAWTSARLDSGNNLQSFQYGRLESSMSLPTGPGLWPAYWALGTNIGTVGWPTSGEMDFMENVPASSGLGPTTIKSTIHGGISSSNCYCGGNGLGLSYTFPSNDPNGTTVATFHTYGAIWSPNMVQFYVDDPTNIFFVRTTSDIPSAFTWDFNHPFYLLLNLAVGGTGSWPGPPDNTTPNPAVMQVDYVRYYTPSTIAPPTMTAPSITTTAGTTGTTTASVTAASGTVNRVYFNCTTTAPKANCSLQSQDPLDQYTLNFSSAGTSSLALSVTTTANTASAATNRRTTLLGSFFAGTFLLFVPIIIPARKRGLYAIPLCLSLVFLLMVLPGCGGSSNNSTTTTGNDNGTPPGSYTVTLNAYTVSNTTGNPDATLSIPLTVN
jgi:beta-glucanase (GH16 family)